MQRFHLLLLLLLSALAGSADAQGTIYVNADAVEHVLDSRRNIGFNLNTWSDTQAGRDLTNQQALTNLGTRYLRFPGGEKADGYRWSSKNSAGNYTNPATSTLTRPDRWPGGPYADPVIWNSSQNKWARSNYNFNIFLQDCTNTGSVPVVVVALDHVFLKTGQAREDAIIDAVKMARDWVKYAKTKSPKVGYWELGNESWLENAWAGSVASAGNTGTSAWEYAKVAKRIARAMKAEDSSIKIGVNAPNIFWFNYSVYEFQQNPQTTIDFIAVHSYPYYGVSSFSTYANNTRNVLTSEVNDLVNHNQTVNWQGQSAPKVILSEFSASGYQVGSSWEKNTVGQALANFEMCAQAVEDDRLLFSQFWGSRYRTSNYNVVSDFAWYALDDENRLTPQGVAISILAKEARKNMIGATNAGKVQAYATMNDNKGNLTIFLVNKNTSAATVNLELQNYPAGAKNVNWQSYHGGGQKENAYSFTKDPSANWPINSNLLSNLSLPAVSITVIKITRAGGRAAVTLGEISAAELAAEVPAEEVQIYPNPTTDRLYLTNFIDRTPYQLRQADGKVIAAGLLDDSGISTIGLPTGLYFLRVETNEGLILRKFVKQ